MKWKPKVGEKVWRAGCKPWTVVSVTEEPQVQLYSDGLSQTVPLSAIRPAHPIKGRIYRAKLKRNDELCRYGKVSLDERPGVCWLRYDGTFHKVSIDDYEWTELVPKDGQNEQ